MGSSDLQFIDTKLDAINLCMRAIGREGVDAVDSGDLDAEDANKMINIVSQRFQYKQGGGWWFNRETNWKFTPDTNGEVELPNNCLAVYQTFGIDKKYGLTMRARRLYSTYTHSFDMRPFVNQAGYINLTLVQLLPFEHLPTTVMQAITYQAAVEFIVSKDADQTKLQTNQTIAGQLYIDVQSEESAQYRHNMFVHNPTQRLFGVMGGGSNNAASFSHTPYDNSPPRIWR